MRVVLHFVVMALSVFLSESSRAAEPQPAPEQTKPLSALVESFKGEWQCAGQFSNWKTITSKESFDSLLGGAWLQQIHHDDPPYGYHAVSMWGVDRESGQLLVTIYDVTGGRRVFSSRDFAHPTTILSIVPRPEIWAVSERFIYERKSATTFSFEYQVPQASGAWKMVDHLECKRIN